MAIIKCKECGKDISDKAEKCPSCGAPISKKGSQNEGEKILCFILGIILLFVGLSMTFDGTSKMLNTSEKSSTIQSSSKITLDKFNQIETGMNYDEVVNIIGENGTILSQVDMDIGDEYKTEVYYWYGENGISNANITFQGGKVVAKAQVGLK